MDAVKSVYSNYANFGGRARRSEYWYFILFMLLVELACIIVSAVIGRAGDGPNAIGMVIGLALMLFGLASIIPGLALTIRRLHDSDRSGWWILIGLIPFIGGILLLIWYCTPGTTGPNKFGPDPKTASPTSATAVF